MTKNKKFDFAQAIKELEEINNWFQSEEINLDEGLAKFRRGLSLIKKCRERLMDVENEFTEIKKEYANEEKKENREEPL
ncbi:exodeoxyribonuclease VII small subunit [Candidatus Gottesmanbacteria bacterium]|nr:exodeoxyribonuclease VII small subunit [Candidatus Gottesmanbacteria bacterium]